MDHPLIDPKSMGDEEILKKIALLNSRLNYAHAMMAYGDRSMVDSLMAMISTLQFEYEERLAIRAKDAWDKQFPEIIETDWPAEKIESSKGKASKRDDEARPKFNKKFVRTDMDIKVTPTKHAPKEDDDDTK